MLRFERARELAFLLPFRFEHHRIGQKFELQRDLVLRRSGCAESADEWQHSQSAMSTSSSSDLEIGQRFVRPMIDQISDLAELRFALDGPQVSA